MSENWLIAIFTVTATAAIVGMQTLIGFFIARWQISVSSKAAQPASATRAPTAARQSPQAPPARKTMVKYESEWPVPPRLVKAFLFVIQTVAIYLLAQQYQDSTPPTRAGTIFIAAMVGVVAICIVLPFVLSIYDYIDNAIKALTD